MYDTGIMTENRKIRLVLTAALLKVTTRAMAYEEVDDLVDIFTTGGRFIAMVDGRRNFSEARPSGEKFLWQGAKGEVGAFLTSDRI